MSTATPTAERERYQLIRVALTVQVVATMVNAGMVLTTPAGPDRSRLLAIATATLVLSAIPALLPRRLLVTDRGWDALIACWSIVGMGMIAAGVAQRGADSPYGMFFIVVALAGLTTSSRAAVVITAFDVVISGVAFAVAPRGTLENFVVLASIIVVTAAFCRWRLASQERQRAHLTEISQTDALTGVLNRRGFEQALGDAIGAHAAGALTGFTLVTVDLDGFKQVNDVEGHAAGDAVLRRVGAAMTGALRTGDQIGRLGGDEFAAILLGAATPSAGPLARIDAALELEGIPASLGAAHFPTAGADAELLQHVADEAMYAVKRTRAAA